MSKQSDKKNYFAAGTALLTAAAYLCVKGLKKVEERLKKPKK